MACRATSKLEEKKTGVQELTAWLTYQCDTLKLESKATAASSLIKTQSHWNPKIPIYWIFFYLFSRHFETPSFLHAQNIWVQFYSSYVGQVNRRSMLQWNDLNEKEEKADQHNKRSTSHIKYNKNDVLNKRILIDGIWCECAKSTLISATSLSNEIQGQVTLQLQMKAGRGIK